MDLPKEPIDEKESLEIIHRMINKAKNDLSNQAFYPILWGWVVFVGSIVHYSLLKYSAFDKPWLAWVVVIFGIVGSAIKGYNTEKESGATNYSGNIVALIWVIF